jgi:hypothetical protein
VSDLFSRLATTRSRLGLKLEQAIQHIQGLVLGEGDVGVVMETKDLRRVVDGKALDILYVALQGKNNEIFEINILF